MSEESEKDSKVNMFKGVIQTALNKFKSHIFNEDRVCTKCGYDLSGATDYHKQPVKSCDEIYYIKDILE